MNTNEVVAQAACLRYLFDCTNLKKNDNRMIGIPVKKNDCHSRENGNPLSYSEKYQPTGKQKKDKI